MNSSDLDALARAVTTPMRDFVTNLFTSTTKRIESLEKRLSDLEARPEMRYAGVFEAERVYRAGETVTSNGSLWCALKTPPGDIPGPGWQLCAKKGPRRPHPSEVPMTAPRMYKHFDDIPTRVEIDRLFSLMSTAKERLREGVTLDGLTDPEWNAIEILEPSTAARLHSEQRAHLDREQQRANELRQVLVPDEATPEILELAEHAVQLCMEHKIRAVLNRREGVGGYANATNRVITVPRIISEISYATVLHEIGHIVDPRRESGFSKKLGGVVYAANPVGERAAWNWASHNALRWTRKMHQDLTRCLADDAARYRKQSDGDGDLSLFTACVRESASKICDRPLSFDEVAKQISSIEIVTKGLESSGSGDLASHLETQVKELLNNAS